MFRSPALRTAGVLHRAAVKGKPSTVPELLGLGIVRTAKTMRKVLGQLNELPSPLATPSPDERHAQRILWTLHPLTSEAETINLQYLNQLPGAMPKMRAQQEIEYKEQQQNYVRWFGGHHDVATAYAQDVEPFIIPDPNNPGCMVWAKEPSEDGYARPYPSKPYLTVHRMAWLALVGYLAPGHALHHACGNRACASVYHLMPVTPEQHRAIHQTAV
ncbi:HNH endonuclease signature motif containing protein [Arthrobacter sp. MYb227]|uniref:HNH endonuclease signature motif containing protein n=1 Tax=Arthrobacter sp. MYb227 TaxID=1848601 RepID=UPI0021577A07|nr:HNH endonuclease signature motif containing protein [Arthrobacter sp. MYb227]